MAPEGTTNLRVGEWGFNLRQIADYPASVLDERESVIARAVNAANYDLATELRRGERVLEIGCGASSFLLDHLPEGVRWDGVDVHRFDGRGRRSIATVIGSVSTLPFSYGTFDRILSNQSIEHWHEFSVSIAAGLREIARVMKTGGTAHLNFPLHLHGHPWFVLGDTEAILKSVDRRLFRVSDVVGYEDRNAPAYPGWRRCGFPNWYVCRLRPAETSFTVNLVLERLGAARQAVQPTPGTAIQSTVRRPAWRLAYEHGLMVLAWKLARKIWRGSTGA